MLAMKSYFAQFLDQFWDPFFITTITVLFSTLKKGYNYSYSIPCTWEQMWAWYMSEKKCTLTKFILRKAYYFVHN